MAKQASSSRVADAFKGSLVGASEALPGISGGTVALIVGVYERLIAGASHVTSAIRLGIADVPRGQGLRRAGAEFRQADWRMIVPLMIGMVVGLLLSSALLAPLVTDHKQYAYAVFFGLVLASLWVPFSGSGRHWGLREWPLALLGAGAAFWLTSLSASVSPDNMLVVFFSGAIAVSALILPGLSGSFLLLALGMYEPTIEALNERDFGYLGVFMGGLLVGLAIIVKVLRWLLENFHRVTLVILTGVMAGALRALWPWQGEDEHDTSLYAPTEGVPLTLALGVAGFVVVATVLVIGHRKERAAAAAGGGDDDGDGTAPPAQRARRRHARV
ncbi:DUF368 domain-containing protein [Streptomyces xiamenensis]|uniref:DUF368 domain-containing protein n=1 Tax=Streptomyces xiamenensis TaxID=408015 RepID=UPI0037D53BF8